MPNDLEISRGLFGAEPGEVAFSVKKKNKQLQYWKKCSGTYNNADCPIHTTDFSWVTTGPVMTPLTAIEYTEFQASKHMTPLPEYGQYEVGKVSGQEYNLSDQYTRFKAIIAQGGIKEFPLDQMIAYNWHRIEPIRTRYPELKNIQDIRCEHGCRNRIFTIPEDYRTHIKVWHQDIAAPEAIGKEFNKAIESLSDKMFGVGQLTPEIITQIGVSIAQAFKANGAS